MPKILNKNYKKFIEEGVISVLTEGDILRAMNNITGKYTKEARCLITTLYYTGGRPIEVLDVRARDITKDGTFCVIKLRGAKGGLPRPIYLSMKKPLIKELYTYASKLFLDMYVFYHFRGKYVRHTVSKLGVPKVYSEVSRKIRYHFLFWFKDVLDGGVNPYYIRHNRFSKLAERGATMDEIRLIKGAKTYASVTPYIHLSTRGAKKIARLND